jgi:hypothetical protein
MVSMHPKQKEIYSRLTPEQKLDIAIRLYDSARELKAAWLRTRHPDWSETEIQHAVRECFLYARD